MMFAATRAALMGGSQQLRVMDMMQRLVLAVFLSGLFCLPSVTAPQIAQAEPGAASVCGERSPRRRSEDSESTKIPSGAVKKPCNSKDGVIKTNSGDSSISIKVTWHACSESGGVYYKGEKANLYPCGKAQDKKTAVDCKIPAGKKLKMDCGGSHSGQQCWYKVH